jgi:hypothetical protein
MKIDEQGNAVPGPTSHMPSPVFADGGIDEEEDEVNPQF